MPREDDTNYVAPQATQPTANATMNPHWEGTIDPKEIKIHRLVFTNSNCTIEKGRYNGLSVIVKRSANKSLIEREISLLARASRGEFVVCYGGWFEEVGEGIMGLVMQKCAMDLKDWSEKASSFAPADRDNMMLQISEGISKGLAFINNNDIIHNDLKPQNVFIDTYNKPHIGDFGVATNRGEPLLGYTKKYFDKESFAVIPDEISDSWLLGATLWEFWSDESFNVEEDIRFDHIRNEMVKDVLTKLLRSRDQRPSAKQILPLFDSTTMRTDYQTVEVNRTNSPQQSLSQM
ncbi:Interferon-induced, double-stranded RNA-activated protein kinase [Phlyctochytrium bullatum]|nr:Interferon-induced, double-stranded RNA-activated protein kinase [Phlyctochytrium bullatum]